MNARDVIRRLHEHRMWVDRLLVDVARSLTAEQHQTQLPIGQGSVWKTLTHLYAAEFVWLEALQGNDDPLAPGDARGKLPGNQEGELALTSLEELATKWKELHVRWIKYLAAICDESLDEMVYKVSTSSGFGKRFGTRRVDVLLHVCTHAQYTTAQLVNMLRQLGVTTFPDVMLISLARQEARG